MARNFGKENFNVNGQTSIELMFNPPDYKKRDPNNPQYYPISLRKRLMEYERTCEEDKGTSKKD